MFVCEDTERKYIFPYLRQLCRGPVSHLGCPGSVQGQSMWDLWPTGFVTVMFQSTTDLVWVPLFFESYCSCPSPTVLVRVPPILSEYHWFVRVSLFLSEHHRSFPSTADLFRVPPIFSEYHCSCPSTIVFARLLLFLSEYHWSPGTIVLVRVPFLSESYCSRPSTTVLFRIPLIVSE